jgi:predicted transcriptional regulator
MRRFGDILVEEGLIEEDELKKALTLQRKSAYKLGQILIKKGLISEEDALKALSKTVRDGVCRKARAQKYRAAHR